jgi:hypothetical protein
LVEFAMELNSNAAFFNVRPPRIEDAGLEDTALPAHAIQEAFMRAADALQTATHQVQSTAANAFGGIHHDEEEREKNVHKGGVFQESSGNWNGSAALGEKESCLDPKVGGVIKKGQDLVVGREKGPYESDKVEFGKEGVPQLGDKGCVEGLPGDKGEDDIKVESEEGPILVLA